MQPVRRCDGGFRLRAAALPIVGVLAARAGNCRSRGLVADHVGCVVYNERRTTGTTAESEATMHYITAGESHGAGTHGHRVRRAGGTEGVGRPDQQRLEPPPVGYGRGGRQKIERDLVEVRSGVRFGRTLGTPLSLVVKNRDWENWAGRMAAFGEPPADLVREVTPRPGHADLVGALKTNTDDCRQRPRAGERAGDGRARGGHGRCARVLGRTGRGSVLVRGVHRRRGAVRRRRAVGGTRLQAARHRNERGALPRSATTEAMKEGHRRGARGRGEPGWRLPCRGRRVFCLAWEAMPRRPSA